MHLKHLTINGFKSFAKKSELEFSSSITAIVGPNGSGKSNVAEGFRFVLGEQSPSKMRGKKGEDLIWGGSDQVSRGNRAAVSILLDNQKRVFPLDFDEITVVVHTNPDLTGIGKKKPEIFEVGLGGSKENKFNYVKENLKILAQEISGLDQNKFANCLDDGKYSSDVQASANQARTAATGTPTMYINGQKVSPTPTAVQAALQ